MKIIYISGKITGTDDFRERFAAAESKLKLQGWRVINPVKKCAHMSKDTPWEGYMRRCIRLLSHADAIYLLRGWRGSRGAVIEQRLAVELGLTLVTEVTG